MTDRPSPDVPSGTGIVVLASGEGTNLQALINAAGSDCLPARVTAVFSDQPSARALARAQAAGIPAEYIGRPRFPTRAAHEDALAGAIEAVAPSVIVLAGFMRVLGKAFVCRFSGRMINLHPSLLPKYRGLDTHARAIAAGDTWHGATVHFVSEELDAGPSILQYRLRVRHDDTPATLAERVHIGEHQILPRATGWLASGRLRLEDQTVWFDDRRLAEPVTEEATE